MAQTVNYIVAKTSPNLYAAAKQANLSQTQVNQIEQFSFTVDKNKQLLRKPLDTARQDFFKLDEEVQQMLRFLYPDAEYAKEAPDTGDKILGFVKGVGKIAASPLIGLYKAAGVYGRTINLPYLMGRQASQGEEFFSKEVFTDAWDGRRVFDEGALANAVRDFGKDNVEIAKGLLMGKKPGEIIESQGQLTQQFLNSFSKAFNDEPEFKQVMDAVKYAQVSPGRDLARILNKPTTKSPDYISSKTKNVSGFVDFMYQIAVDPLTWVLGGATKIPGLATKVNMGDQMVRNIQQFGTLGVKKSFEESAPLRNHWDKEIGPLVKRLSESDNAADEAAIMREIGTKYAGHENTEWLQLLKRNKIYNAERAVQYFGNDVDAAINLLAGRVEGTQYFRNGVATARNQRRLDFGMGRFVDGIFNPAMAREDVLKQGEDTWTKLTKLGDEGTNYVSPEVADLQKFVKKMTFTERIGQKFARNPQGRAINIGEDAVKTADNFRDTARQVLPRDLADFLTVKFINADASDQVAVLRSLYFSILQRYGLDGHPKGKDFIEAELASHFGSKEGLAITEKLNVPKHFEAEVGATGLKLGDEGATYDSAGIIHPFQEAKSIGNLNYQQIAQLAYEVNHKKNLIMAVGKGATQSKFATDLVNTWTILTLFPRLGVRSAIDEGFIYLLTAPARDIMNSLLPRYAAKGRDAGKIASMTTGSNTGEGFRQALKQAIGLTPTSKRVALRDRLLLKKNIATKYSISDERVSQAELIADTTDFSARLYGISRLTDEELDFLKDALVHNQHILNGAAGSLAARASLSGKYSPEVAEQLIDLNNFERMLQEADVVSGFKGTLVDTRDLARSKEFNGNAVAAVYFENWVRRFYGNRRAVKGFNDETGTERFYSFNPVQAFFENNGLKTADDVAKAKQMLLKDVGVVANGKITKELGDAAGSVSTRYTYTVDDSKALEDFLTMSARSTQLRQQGYSDVDIAADQIDRILLDMYQTFHGDANKFNDNLLARVNSAHGKYKAEELEKGVDIKNKWNLAVQSLEFDEFAKLTDGFTPSGKMYTLLDIDGLVDVESAFAKLGNNMMEIMDRQVTGLLRQPAVMTAYFRIRKNYSKLQAQEANAMASRQIENLKQQGINPNSVKYVKTVNGEKVQVTWADDVRADIKEIVARKYSEIAIQQAADSVLKFADNPNIRTNFALSVRNVGRFYRATEDFWRRVYRLKDASPRVLYRMRLMHTGIEANGEVYEDAKGDPYLIMPMDDVIFKTVENVTRTLTGNTAFQQPLFNDITLKLKLANPSFSPDAGMPTLSGPIAALGIVGMRNLLGVTGTTGKKVAEELDNYALGTIGEGMTLVRALVPSSLQRLYAILPVNEKNRQEATAAMQAIAFNAAQGNIPKATDTAEQKYEYLKNVRLSAHNLMVMRSVLGLVSPITPTIQESKGVPDYLKAVGITGLRPEFYDLVNAITKKYGGDIQDPYDLAVSTFVGKNPGKIIYTVSRDEKQTNVVIQKTKEMKKWFIENKGLVDKYGEAAFIFAPQTGEFDAASYAWLEGADFIQNKNLEKYYLDVMLSQDKQAYFNIAKEENEALSQTVSASARRAIIEGSTDKRQAMKAANPFLESAITGGGNEIASETIMFQSMEQILIDGTVKIPPATRSKLLVISTQIRDFINIASNPELRETRNFADIKRQRKADIEALIAQMLEGDLIVKEANRAVFQTILDYYSRDTYRV
jgi:hypothetical protein